MKKSDVDLVTLGCSKNLVDSERLIGMLSSSGFSVRHDPDESLKPAPIVIINTCGFIADAKEESINTILQYCESGARVIVMGCLSQRYRSELPGEIPEVDAWFGKFEFDAVVEYVKSVAANNNPTCKDSRRVTTGPSHAYIKIAEGCNRFCAFCAIPLITGRFKSRPIDDIVAEVENLTRQGFTEFNVIAQDLSSYGTDIYGRHRLADLVEAISRVDKVKWIRLHYAYPADFPYDILPVIKNNPKVCKYLDIALQHIADPVLDNMRRHFSSEQTKELIERIRREVPGIHLRTTLMVGFPGEGESEFQQLCDFVKEVKFERMGAFAYSEEDDTYAAKKLNDDIPQDLKQARLDKIMGLQEEISMDIQSGKVGQTFTVVIDREDDDYFVGRTEFDSPEVDPEVLIAKPADRREIKPGTYHQVRVTSALPFELIGEFQ